MSGPDTLQYQVLFTRDSETASVVAGGETYPYREGGGSAPQATRSDSSSLSLLHKVRLRFPHSDGLALRVDTK